MAEIGRGEIWVANAGHELNLEYPLPSTEELVTAWESYLEASQNVVAAPEVFGVVRLPSQRPTAYASIDLCEILRQTGIAVRAVEDQQLATQPPAYYAASVSVHDVTPISQVLINNNLVPPIDTIEAIAEIVQRWSGDGVYLLVNTSTHPGCELATIRFLKQYMPRTFDGILFPRNHDGSSPLTKGVAARNVLLALEAGERSATTAIHIDDTTHHDIGFRQAMQALPNVHVATFQPVYPWGNPGDAGSVQTTTPLEAFEQADAFLRQQLTRAA